MPPPPPAVVLLSGGLDSATALAVARSEGFVCHALSIDYGQRHANELAAAAAVARALGAASHRTVAVGLAAIGGSALTDPSLGVPKSGPSPDHIPITYVPARNLIFLSIATACAESLGAQDLFIGVNAVDYSGYPDCREPFIRAFEHAANLGTKAGAQEARPFRVHIPLVHLTKARIIRLGTDLGVDFALTHSCYDPVPDADGAWFACGRCDSCAIRRAGFHAAGIADPTRYAVRQTGGWPAPRTGARQ